MTVDNLHIDLSTIGSTKFNVDGSNFEVEVINSITDYVDFMKDLFDFAQLKDFLKDCKIVVNGMNAGIYFWSLFMSLFLNFFNELYFNEIVVQIEGCLRLH